MSIELNIGGGDVARIPDMNPDAIPAGAIEKVMKKFGVSAEEARAFVIEFRKDLASKQQERDAEIGKTLEKPERYEA